MRHRELNWCLEGHILSGEVGKDSIRADLALLSRSPDPPSQRGRGDAGFRFRASVAQSEHFCS